MFRLTSIRDFSNVPTQPEAFILSLLIDDIMGLSVPVHCPSNGESDSSKTIKRELDEILQKQETRIWRGFMLRRKAA